MTVRLHTLTRNESRWYADRLAAALWGHRMKRLDTDPHFLEKPHIRTFGVGQVDIPKLLTVRTDGHPRVFVRPGLISLAGSLYTEALSQLTPDQWRAWFDYLHSPIPSALFTSEGISMRRGRNSGKQEQDASLVIITYADVEVQE